MCYMECKITFKKKTHIIFSNWRHIGENESGNTTEEHGNHVWIEVTFSNIC